MFESSMKKYVQLCLIILSAISTILFLFYKHEYNRLRTVLEVLDTFGSDVQAPLFQSVNVNVSAIKDVSSFSVWRKIGPVYMYSAFVKYDDKQVRVQILAVVPIHFQGTGSCGVWFDNDRNPTIGNLAVRQLWDKLESGSSLKPVLLECIAARTGKTAHAVTPYYKPGNNEAIDIVQELFKKRKGSVQACVLPFSNFFSSHLDLAQFLVYHEAVGIKKFHFYVNSVSLAVKKILSTQERHAVVTNPWNLPEELDQQVNLPVTNAIAMNDCLFRSRSAASYLFVTDTEKFLVPKHHSSIGAILDDFSVVLTYPISRIHCKYRTFCVGSETHKAIGRGESSLAMLEKTQWQFEGSRLEDVILIKIDKVEIMPSATSKSTDYTYTVPADILVIHWYKVCNRSDWLHPDRNAPFNEPEMALRLKELFRKSFLIQYALSLS